MKLIIDPEFQSLIPPLADEEYSQLEANLKKDGCRDPLVTWQGIIVDGHNRFEICTRHGIGFEQIRKHFADRSEAIEWIIRNQFGRRNLSAFQRTELALRLEESIRARAKANMLKGTNQHSPKQNSAEASQHIETREEIAKLAGVSRDTVDKVKQIKKSATPEIKEALAKGEISINKAHQTVKTPKPETDPIEAVVEDGTMDDEGPATPKPKRLSKWIPDDADRLWTLAKSDLDKILKSDLSRERVLREVIQYAQNRIDNNK